jgi:hypothetical protein
LETNVDEGKNQPQTRITTKRWGRDGREEGRKRRIKVNDNVG